MHREIQDGKLYMSILFFVKEYHFINLFSIDPQRYKQLCITKNCFVI